MELSCGRAKWHKHTRIYNCLHLINLFFYIKKRLFLLRLHTVWLHIHTDTEPLFSQNLSEFAAAFLPAVRETRSVQCLSAIFPSIPISFSDLHVSLIHCASKVRDFKPLWLSPLHPTVFHPDRKLLHFSYLSPYASERIL